MQRRGLNVRKALMRLILPGLRRLPPRAATRLVAGIGHAEYAMVGGLRLQFDRAVAEIREFLDAEWDVAEVGRELAGNQIRWRTRDQLLDNVDDVTFGNLFRVEGRDHLDAAFAEGKGIVLLGNHFGAHLMPAHWLARMEYPLRLFMERPHHVSKLLSRTFETEGPLGQKKLFISRKSAPSEAAGAILRAGRVLKAGMAIFIASDVRWSGPNTAPARFLGREHNFSATWAVLASLTGAPVVPVFCSMRTDGSHDLEFLPPFHVANGPPLAVAVQRAIEQIEERVRREPGNSNDYFFWTAADEPSRARAAGRARKGEAA